MANWTPLEIQQARRLRARGNSYRHVSRTINKPLDDVIACCVSSATLIDVKFQREDLTSLLYRFYQGDDFDHIVNWLLKPAEIIEPWFYKVRDLCGNWLGGPVEGGVYTFYPRDEKNMLYPTDDGRAMVFQRYVKPGALLFRSLRGGYYEGFSWGQMAEHIIQRGATRFEELEKMCTRD